MEMLLSVSKALHYSLKSLGHFGETAPLFVFIAHKVREGSALAQTRTVSYAAQPGERERIGGNVQIEIREAVQPDRK
jgi:hypothetical protein